MRILVTGGSGLLGNAIVKEAIGKHEVFATYNSHPVSIDGCEFVKVDLIDKQEALRIVQEIKPDVVIHTVALTNLDFAEENPGVAYDVNVKTTENMCEACKSIGAKVVYISTDYVFDGNRGNYSEEDNPNPESVYAKTKLQGEEVVINSGVKYLIPRTTIYGWNIQEKICFPELVIKKLSAGEEMTLFIDQYNTPILTNNLARVLFELIEKKINGILHVAGSERISRFDFGVKIAEVFGLDKGMIKPISIKDFNFKAKRPLDCSLNTMRCRSLLVENELLNAEDGLRVMKDLR
ncbi:SDR family oxidoreductase [Candidatus Woesearchaeota archaeon]|nr:SDR family oxidoreductase [Candidatus Woesearchaeota archaeon]